MEEELILEDVYKRQPYGNVGMDHLLSKEKVQRSRYFLFGFGRPKESSKKSIFEN